MTLTEGRADLDALKAAITPLVSYDLTPLEVRSLGSFPLTPTGKIAKAELRQSAISFGLSGTRLA